MVDRYDETWHRLREWTNGQAPSERLAAQILVDQGFSDGGGAGATGENAVAGDGGVAVKVFWPRSARFFEGSLFAQIGVSEYAQHLGEQLQFNAAGQPVSVGNEQMSWLYDSLGKEATFRVRDDRGAVVPSSDRQVRR